MMEPYREQEREREREGRREPFHPLLDMPLSEPVSFTMRDLLETVARVRKKQAIASAALFWWTLWCGFIVWLFATLDTIHAMNPSSEGSGPSWICAGLLLLGPYLVVRYIIRQQVAPP